MPGLILITGASGGLASELIDTAKRDGWTPVAVTRSDQALEELSSRGITAARADVSTFDGAHSAIEACREAGGVPEAMVNCAGRVFIRPLHRTSEDDYRACMAANSDTAFFTLQAYVEACLEDNVAGKAVLVSTVAAQTGVQNHEAVAASKAAVEALTRSAAATYADKGIRVNAIAPGLTETPAVEQFLRSEASREAMARQYPLGRVGQPQDLCSAILWLLCENASWITGQVLAVDGGFTSVRPMVK